MKNPIPYIIAAVTKHPRQLFRWSEIQWSSKSWTHNAFRVFEFICGRKYGVRPELLTIYNRDEKGDVIVHYFFHTWEAAIAHFESTLRGAWKTLAARRILPYRLYIPVLATPQGVMLPASPYLFAIAYDTSVLGDSNGHLGGGNPATLTYSHTVTGSQPTILAGIASQWGNSPSRFQSGTYAGASMTQLGVSNSGSWDGTVYYKINPSTGANNVALTVDDSGFQPIMSASISYTGTNQSALDNNTTSTGGSTTFAISITVNTANSWVMAFVGNSQNSALGVGSGTTSRQAGMNNNGNTCASILGDSNGALAAGSQTLNFTSPSSSAFGGVIVSIAPVAVATTNTPFFLKMVNQ